MGFVVFLLGILFLVGAVAVVRWIAAPIESLARARQARTQFMVSDLLVLFAMLQLAVGTVHYVAMGWVESQSSSGAPKALAFAMDGAAAFIILLSWWCGANMVSRAGITHWRHRAIILGFVVPCGTISLAAMVILSVATLILLFADLASAARLMGVLLLLSVVVGVCGLATRWIAAKYQPSEVVGQGEPGQVAQPHSRSMKE